MGLRPEPKAVLQKGPAKDAECLRRTGRGGSQGTLEVTAERWRAGGHQGRLWCRAEGAGGAMWPRAQVWDSPEAPFPGGHAVCSPQGLAGAPGRTWCPPPGRPFLSLAVEPPPESLWLQITHFCTRRRHLPGPPISLLPPFLQLGFSAMVPSAGPSSAPALSPLSWKCPPLWPRKMDRTVPLGVRSPGKTPGSWPPTFSWAPI